MKVLLEKLDTVIQSENNGRWVTIKGRHIFVPKGQSIHFDKEGSYKPMTSGEKEAKHQKTVEKTGKERPRVESEYSEKQEKRKKEAGYKEEPSKSTQNKIKRKQEAIKSHISKFQELNKTHKSSALSEFIKFIVDILAESQKKKSDLRAPIRSAITRLRQRIKKEKLTNSQKEVILKQIEKLAKEVKELSGDFVGNIFDTTIKTHETENYIRKRQFDPSECEEGTYRTFTIGKGKKVVGCKVKGKFKAQSILEPKKDLVEDYPVEQYERTSSKGTEHKVQAHTRGEGKKEQFPTFTNLGLKQKNKEEIEQEKKQKEDPNYIIEQSTKALILYLKDQISNKILEAKIRLQKQITNLEDILKIRNKEFRKEELIQEFEKLLAFFSLEKKEYGESESYGKIKIFLDKLKEKDWLDVEVLEQLEKELEEGEKTTFTSLGLKKTYPKKDLIPLSSFKQIKHDFQEDFTILHGSIARDGSYDYWDDKGKKYTLYKDWDNLKEVYPKLDYAVVRGTDKKNAHIANEIESFAYNFIPNETTHEIEFDLVLMNDLPTLTKLLNPKEGYHVSPGYTDEVIGNTQYVRKVDHIAISLGNKDQARACTGQNEQGKSCTTVKEVQIHDQNLSEVVN